MAAKRRSQSGFTIIEIMIVLGISGMILGILLMAIPALQRMSRNNERKSDVSAILTAVSRYQARNSGDFPDNCGPVPSGPNCAGINLFLNRTTLYYYDDSDVSVIGSSASSGDVTGIADDNSVQVYNYHRCTSDGGVRATDKAAGYFDIAALYRIETANGTALQCRQL
jgi:prepilin-type N-terminal cleavage/methylation domain-containing protein